MKSKKLSLGEMWSIYKLNNSGELDKAVPRSLQMLYPKMSFQDMEINDKIVWYFRGLNENLYFHFQGLISRLRSHG